MTFKEKALKELENAEKQEMGPARSVIRECRELVEKISEEQNECCAAPNYEAMYHETMEKLQEMQKTAEIQHNEIQNLRNLNYRLAGFKEAIEMVYGKGRDFHGCP